MQKMAAYALHLLQGAPQLPGIPRICAAVSNAVEQPGEVFLEVVTFLEETMSSPLWSVQEEVTGERQVTVLSVLLQSWWHTEAHRCGRHCIISPRGHIGTSFDLPQGSGAGGPENQQYKVVTAHAPPPPPPWGLPEPASSNSCHDLALITRASVTVLLWAQSRRRQAQGRTAVPEKSQPWGLSC